MSHLNNFQKFDRLKDYAVCCFEQLNRVKVDLEETIETLGIEYQVLSDMLGNEENEEIDREGMLLSLESMRADLSGFQDSLHRIITLINAFNTGIKDLLFSPEK